MRIAVALPVLLTFLSCVSPRLVETQPAYKVEDIPVVFIHGMLGSVLVDSSDEIQYLTAGEALGLRTPDLRLPTLWDGDKQPLDDLRPAGPLMRVGLIRHVIDQAVYAPWIEVASHIPGRPFYAFSYDWRRDGNESADQFEKFIETISKRHGKKVQIIAHSMGGIITLVVQNRRPDLIDRVVFAGVPFRGGLGYLDNLYLGTPIGANKNLLSPEVIFSHPGVYSFYPAGQSFENKTLAEDESGKALDIDFLDIDAWQKNGFGPFASQNKSWGGEKHKAFLAGTLARIRSFRKKMQPDKSKSYPRALVITSDTYPTLARIRRIPPASGESVPRWDFDSAAKGQGDGSVLRADAIPPDPIQSEVYLSKYGHSYLLNDPNAQDAIVKFLK